MYARMLLLLECLFAITTKCWSLPFPQERGNLHLEEEYTNMYQQSISAVCSPVHGYPIFFPHR